MLSIARVWSGQARVVGRPGRLEVDVVLDRRAGDNFTGLSVVRSLPTPVDVGVERSRFRGHRIMLPLRPPGQIPARILGG